MEKKRIISLMIVGLLLFSSLGILAGTTRADVINQPNDFNIRVYYTDVDDRTWYRGDNMTFEVGIENDGSEDIYHCNLSVNTQVHDVDGNPVTSPFIWHQQDVNDDVTITHTWGGYRHIFSGFWATVKPDAAYGRYNITVHLDFENSTGAHFYYEAYVIFRISNRVAAHMWSGDSTYPGEVDHSLYMYLTSARTVHEVYWNLSTSDHDFQFTHGSESTYTDDLYAGNWWESAFIFNVSKEKAPGDYEFTWRVEYTFNGERVHDEGSFNITVRTLGTIEMSANVDEIVRGTSTMNITFSFTNTGNADLTGLKIRLDPVSMTYFTIPQTVERYEGSHTIYEQSWVDVGDVAQGQTATKTIKIIIDSHLPAGKHKVLFDFKAECNNETVFSGWRWVSSPEDGSSAHFMPYWEEWSGAWSYYPDDSETLHTGAYVMFDIVGDVFDMEITPSVGVSGTSASLIREDNIIHLVVDNNEYRNYRDLSFMISTASGSPFVNPDDPSAEWSEPYNVSYLQGGRSTNIYLHVRTREGLSAGYYDVPVMVRATDMTTTNTVENVVSTRILITGSGAKPVIADMSVGEIKAGGTFTVTMTIENRGDDVARNLMVELFADSTLQGSDIVVISGPPKIDSLEPGQSTTVQFTLAASSDMGGSQTYPLTAEMSYDNMYRGDSDSTTQQVGIQSPSKVTTGDIMSWLLIILVIIAIIGGILFIARNMKKKPAPQPQPVAQPSPAPAPEPQPVQDNMNPPAEEQEVGEDLDTDESEGTF